MRRIARSWCVVLAIVWASMGAGCEPPTGQTTRIDADWHRRDLVEGLLAGWLRAAPTPIGFMRTDVDRSWNPSARQLGYLTGQARLVYSMVAGYELTQDRQYFDAAKRGADFLLTRYRDPESGGFYLRVDQDGKVISEAKNLYAHAFALFALSHVARVTGEARYRQAALLTWNEINLWMRDKKGEFVGELPRNFALPASGSTGARSQNPLMHLFEALLALHDATNDPVALQGARNVGDFIVYRLVRGVQDGGAYIPEWYDSDWKPLATQDKGGYTDIGHQFEWVHLLLEAEQRGLLGVYAQTAERVLDYAVRLGYDEIDGGVYLRIYPDGRVVNDKSWWQQAEAMRTFLLVATLRGQSDMWRRYEQTRSFVAQEFVDKKNGGWNHRPARICAQQSCPTEQIEPYHMTAMHMQALELARAR